MKRIREEAEDLALPLINPAVDNLAMEGGLKKKPLIKSHTEEKKQIKYFTKNGAKRTTNFPIVKK